MLAEARAFRFYLGGARRCWGCSAAHAWYEALTRDRGWECAGSGADVMQRTGVGHMGDQSQS